MNLKSILLCGAAALTLASCSQGSDGRQLGEIKNANAGDSLLYYFGQRQAADYWRAAERDTTFLSEQARRDYMRGIQAGMNAVRSGDDAYNQGVFQGIQMAMNIFQFDEDYNMQLNPKVLVESMQAGLQSDSAVNVEEAQKEFYAIMGRLNQEREEYNRKQAASNLETAQKKLKMQKISNDLYGEVVSKGDTVRLKEGDKLKVSITATDEQGQELALPLPTEVTVGDRYMGPVFSEAYRSMTNGETKRFATTGYALFSGRSERMGVEPDAVIILTIKANLDTPSAAADKTDKEAKAAADKKETEGAPRMKAVPAADAPVKAPTRLRR